MSNLFLGNTFESPRKVNGDVNSGGLVYFYKPGTSEKKNTYTDSTLATAHANPVVLDSYGRKTIFLSGEYKVRVETSDGVLISETDDVNESQLTDSDRYNKVVNGDFEDATVGTSLPSEWSITLYTNGAAVLDSTDRHSGLKSLKFTSTGTGGGYALTDNFISVSPDIPVNVNLSLKSSDAGVRNVVEILWYTSSKVLDSTTTLYDDSTTNPTSWTAKSFAANPPSTAYYAKLRLTGCHSSDATTGSTWFDKVYITQVNQSLSWCSKATDIASAATVDLSNATGNSVTITGTTSITSFGTVQAGAIFVLTFSASLTITHNATSLICPENQNIVTQASDQIVVESLGSGNWRVVIAKPQLTSAFSAYRATTTQSIGAGADTKVEFNAETFDNLSEYDPTTNFRFTAKSAGIYLITAGVDWGSQADGNTTRLHLYKNGVIKNRLDAKLIGGASFASSNGSIMLKLAAGDYLEIFVYTGGANTIQFLDSASYFTGVRIA